MVESWPAAAAWLLVLAWAAITLARLVLAVRMWRPPPDGPEAGVVVLQPILSGDPRLAGQLAANLANLPAARFRWLVDSADAEGVRVARHLAAGAGGRVEVREFGPTPGGVNPKVFKLARAVEPDDELLAVLDDDTVLPPGTLGRARTALAGADLVTGLPYYEAGGSLWSRLVAAFVNGSALITYLPLAAFGPPVSINGMFYLTTAAGLARVGGFASIEHLVCDDHELARRYRAAGLRLVQAAVPHPLRTTVADGAEYLRLMRRWMVFTLRLLRVDLRWPVVLLVVLPAVLPLLALALAAVAGSAAPAIAMLAGLVAKAVTMAVLRRHLFGSAESAAAVLLEVVADLLQPLHAIGAAVGGGRITWRGRPMVLDRAGRVGVPAP